MINLKIIAITPKGEDAIKQHISETFSMNRIKRAMLKKMGYSQEVTRQSPYTLHVKMAGQIGALMKQKHFQDEIVEAMTKNAARIDEDYYLEWQKNN